MISLRTDKSLEMESRMRCKKSLLVGVSGLKPVKLLMLRLPQEVYSPIYKQNLERRVGKMPRRSKVRSTIPSGRMNSLEKLSMKESDKKLIPNRLFSKLSRNSKLLKRKLTTMRNNSSLKKLEKNL